ncbi:hypothetical protein EP331_14600 [bacterium]|nr:MAG: hypothetical protein EP331_14600 [bacterium]
MKNYALLFGLVVLVINCSSTNNVQVQDYSKSESKTVQRQFHPVKGELELPSQKFVATLKTTVHQEGNFYAVAFKRLMKKANALGANIYDEVEKTEMADSVLFSMKVYYTNSVDEKKVIDALPKGIVYIVGALGNTTRDFTIHMKDKDNMILPNKMYSLYLNSGESVMIRIGVAILGSYNSVSANSEKATFYTVQSRSSISPALGLNGGIGVSYQPKLLFNYGTELGYFVQHFISDEQIYPEPTNALD